MKRNPNTMIGLLGLVAVVVGCENLGLDYAGPAEDARQQPPTDLVAAVIQPVPADDRQDLIVDGRLWVPAGRPLPLDEQDLRPIGSASGQTIHARTWDRPPYDELFTPIADDRRWRSYRPVSGGDVTGAAPEGTSSGDDAGH